VSDANQNEQRFSSRLGLILSVLGIAVGTGNIWRFPRIAATNGGAEGAGAFLVAWIVFLLVWSVPLIIAEYALGRHSRMGVVGTFAKTVGERFGWMGAFVGLVATAIMFYYAAIVGWCIYYFGRMVVAPLPATSEAARGIWDAFQGGLWPVLFLALAVGAGGFIVWRGVNSIERANKVLIPTLVAVVLVAVVRAVTLPGAGEGVSFLFTPQWDLLSEPTLWVNALAQNAWDTGAGWGLILTYGAYMQEKHGIVQNAFITGVGNNCISLLAGIIVFGTVFAVLGAEMPRAEVLEVMKDSGPAGTGLTFIWMPRLFAEMPLGRLFAILFFLGLMFAAFSSLISMIELASRILVDLGWRRPTAVGSMAGGGFLLGLPSALSTQFLANQDYVWGVALIISGGFVAFAVMRYGARRLRRDLMRGSPGDWDPGGGWDALIGALVPAQAVALVGWFLYGIYDASGAARWNPFELGALANFLMQWGLALIVLVAANGWLVRRTLAGETREA
jgi:NSS family neurotransmitter:Na+ symporter